MSTTQGHNWQNRPLAAYVPTPKMIAALFGGGLGVVAVLAADWLDLMDVRPAASGLFVLLLAEIGGWIKRDGSSPEPGHGGVEL